MKRLSIIIYIIILSILVMTGLPLITVAYASLIFISMIWLTNRIKKGDFRNLQDIRKYINTQYRGFRYGMWFRPGNNDLEKILAFALFGTWAIVTIGISFGFAEPTREYTVITAIIWMLIGKLWGSGVKDAAKESVE